MMGYPMNKLKLSSSKLSLSLRSGKSPSQALMEFALALPILLIMIFGIIDFALLFQAWLSIENVARQTVRYAVTGEYNTAYCNNTYLSVLGDSSSPYYDSNYDNVPDCLGDSYQAEQDYVRLQSIHDASQQWQVALFKDNSAVSNTAKGYFHLTICSDHKDTSGTQLFTFKPLPVMAGPAYAKCLDSNGNSVENAGDPGDSVVIIVDFNHPLITPFLSQVWPMVHLVSYREGVVETFRTSRSIAQPADVLGNTPTPRPPTATFTPSSTATATDTDTPTNTSTPSKTSTPTATSTPSSTPTKTNTPTATPTFACSQFSLGTFSQTTSGGKPRVNININSASGQDTDLSSLIFTWTSYDGANPGQTLNDIMFNSSTLTGTDDINSPSNWTAGGVYTINGGTSDTLRFDFLTADAAWSGIVPANSFGLSVTLSNGCVLNVAAVPFNTPTPSKTSTPTLTFTPSRTPTPSNTPTKTSTPTASNTATRTSTPTKTSTPTPVTPSKTPTQIIIPSKTNTPLPTRTPVTPIG